MFLIKKAVLAGLIAAGLTLGTIALFGQPSKRTSGTSGNGDFLSSSTRMDLPCNCQVISQCHSPSGSGQGIRIRFCGFEGFQRKVCCDSKNETELTETQKQDAQAAADQAKFYRNPNLYKSEDLNHDTGQGRTEDLEINAKDSISPMDILQLDPIEVEATTEKVRVTSESVPVTSEATTVSSQPLKITSEEVPVTSEATTVSSQPLKMTPGTVAVTSEAPTESTLIPDSVLKAVEDLLKSVSTSTQESVTADPTKQSRKLLTSIKDLFPDYYGSEERSSVEGGDSPGGKSIGGGDNDDLGKIDYFPDSVLSEFFPEYYEAIIKNLTTGVEGGSDEGEFANNETTTESAVTQNQMLSKNDSVSEVVISTERSMVEVVSSSSISKGPSSIDLNMGNPSGVTEAGIEGLIPDVPPPVTVVPTTIKPMVIDNSVPELGPEDASVPASNTEVPVLTTFSPETPISGGSTEIASSVTLKTEDLEPSVSDTEIPNLSPPSSERSILPVSETEDSKTSTPSADTSAINVSSNLDTESPISLESFTDIPTMTPHTISSTLSTVSPEVSISTPTPPELYTVKYELDIRLGTTSTSTPITEKIVPSSEDFTISGNEIPPSTTGSSSLIRDNLITEKTTETNPSTSDSSILSSSEASKSPPVEFNFDNFEVTTERVDTDTSSTVNSLQKFTDFINELEQSSPIEKASSTTETIDKDSKTSTEATTSVTDMADLTTIKNAVQSAEPDVKSTLESVTEINDFDTKEFNSGSTDPSSLTVELTTENSLAQKLPKVPEALEIDSTTNSNVPENTEHSTIQLESVSDSTTGSNGPSESSTISSIILEAMTTLKSGVSTIVNKMSPTLENTTFDSGYPDMTTIPSQIQPKPKSLESLENEEIKPSMETITLGNLFESSSTVSKLPADDLSNLDKMDVLEEKVLGEMEKSSTTLPITSTPAESQPSMSPSFSTVQPEATTRKEINETTSSDVDEFDINVESDTQNNIGSGRTNNVQSLLVDEVSTNSPDLMRMTTQITSEKIEQVTDSEDSSTSSPKTSKSTSTESSIDELAQTTSTPIDCFGESDKLETTTVAGMLAAEVNLEHTEKISEPVGTENPSNDLSTTSKSILISTTAGYESIKSTAKLINSDQILNGIEGNESVTTTKPEDYWSIKSEVEATTFRIPQSPDMLEIDNNDPEMSTSISTTRSETLKPEIISLVETTTNQNLNLFNSSTISSTSILTTATDDYLSISTISSISEPEMTTFETPGLVEIFGKEKKSPELSTTMSTLDTAHTESTGRQSLEAETVPSVKPVESTTAPNQETQTISSRTETPEEIRDSISSEPFTTALPQTDDITTTGSTISKPTTKTSQETFTSPASDFEATTTSISSSSDRMTTSTGPPNVDNLILKDSNSTDPITNAFETTTIPVTSTASTISNADTNSTDPMELLDYDLDSIKAEADDNLEDDKSTFGNDNLFKKMEQAIENSTTAKPNVDLSTEKVLEIEASTTFAPSITSPSTDMPSDVDEIVGTTVTTAGNIDTDISGNRIPKGKLLVEDVTGKGGIENPVDFAESLTFDTENDTLNEVIPTKDSEFVLNITEVFPTKTTEMVPGGSKVKYGDDTEDNEILGEKIPKLENTVSINSTEIIVELNSTATPILDNFTEQYEDLKPISSTDSSRFTERLDLNANEIVMTSQMTGRDEVTTLPSTSPQPEIVTTNMSNLDRISTTQTTEVQNLGGEFTTTIPSEELQNLELINKPSDTKEENEATTIPTNSSTQKADELEVATISTKISSMKADEVKATTISTEPSSEKLEDMETTTIYTKASSEKPEMNESTTIVSKLSSENEDSIEGTTIPTKLSSMNTDEVKATTISTEPSSEKLDDMETTPISTNSSTRKPDDLESTTILTKISFEKDNIEFTTIPTKLSSINTDEVKTTTISIDPSSEKVDDMESTTTSTKPSTRGADEVEATTISIKLSSEKDDTIEGTTIPTKPSSMNTDELKATTISTEPSSEKLDDMESTTTSTNSSTRGAEELEAITTSTNLPTRGADEVEATTISIKLSSEKDNTIEGTTISTKLTPMNTDEVKTTTISIDPASEKLDDMEATITSTNASSEKPDENESTTVFPDLLSKSPDELDLSTKLLVEKLHEIELIEATTRPIDFNTSESPIEIYSPNISVNLTSLLYEETEATTFSTKSSSEIPIENESIPTSISLTEELLEGSTTTDTSFMTSGSTLDTEAIMSTTSTYEIEGKTSLASSSISNQNSPTSTSESSATESSTPERTEAETTANTELLFEISKSEDSNDTTTKRSSLDTTMSPSKSDSSEVADNFMSRRDNLPSENSESTTQSFAIETTTPINIPYESSIATQQTNETEYMSTMPSPTSNPSLQNEATTKSEEQSITTILPLPSVQPVTANFNEVISDVTMRSILEENVTTDSKSNEPKTPPSQESVTEIRRVDINFDDETLDEFTTNSPEIKTTVNPAFNDTLTSTNFPNASEFSTDMTLGSTFAPEFDEISNKSDKNRSEESTKAVNLILDADEFTTTVSSKNAVETSTTVVGMQYTTQAEISSTMMTTLNTGGNLGEPTTEFPKIGMETPTTTISSSIPQDIIDMSTVQPELIDTNSSRPALRENGTDQMITSTIKYSSNVELSENNDSSSNATETPTTETIFTEANTEESTLSDRNASSVIDTTDSMISFDPSDTARELAENTNSSTSTYSSIDQTTSLPDESSTMLRDPEFSIYSEPTVSLLSESITLTPESLEGTTLTPETSTLQAEEEVITSVSRVISKPKVLKDNQFTTEGSAPKVDRRTSTETTHSVRKEPEKDKTVVELVRQLSKVKTKITQSVHTEQNLPSTIEDGMQTSTVGEAEETTTSAYDVTENYQRGDNTSEIMSLISRNDTALGVTEVPENETLTIEETSATAKSNLTLDIKTGVVGARVDKSLGIESSRLPENSLNFDENTDLREVQHFGFGNEMATQNSTDDPDKINRTTNLPIIEPLEASGILSGAIEVTAEPMGSDGATTLETGTESLDIVEDLVTTRSPVIEGTTIVPVSKEEMTERSEFEIVEDLMTLDNSTNLDFETTTNNSQGSIAEIGLQTTNIPTIERTESPENTSEFLTTTQTSGNLQTIIPENIMETTQTPQSLKVIPESLENTTSISENLETTSTSIPKNPESLQTPTEIPEKFMETTPNPTLNPPELPNSPQNASELPEANITKSIESVSISTSESRSTKPENQTLFNLFNEIFGSLTYDPKSTLHPPPHYPARINDRKLILEISQPDPNTPETRSDELTVNIKIGPGPGPTPGARALFPAEAMEVEAQLQNQISNVVNQLLLTTHENYRLLPSFIECASATRRGRRKTRVLNFDTENYPWMARIGYKEPGGVTFSCAGTIISRRYILTSAYCANKNPGAITEVLLESAKHLANPSELKYKYEVERVIPHPEYSPSSRLNDLALLRVTSDIQFNSSSEIKPICLPFEDGYGVWDSMPRVGDLAYLGGWGFEQKNKTKKLPDLQESSVRIWPNDNCTKAFEGDKDKRITSSQICAYASPENNACRGDGGAPLMAVMTRHRIFFQIGVVSYGPQCGFQVPRIYTRVSDYLRWILDVMEP